MVPVTSVVASASSPVAVTNTSVVPKGTFTVAPSATVAPFNVIVPIAVFEDTAARITFSVYSRVVRPSAAVTVITTSLSPVTRAS